ncbi:DUF1311 domain-containing protein [Aestuariicoccus sp. KMU-90]|uniref:DUF1311 domain-containing protein n=2 Tax=Thetidibacter halocola TaxID=2827239 RepID=A0A8J7WF69_9RHOB|nr:lysozyme inhibitor LprI family protein [Thetidibacter halocola]MBS0124271.1 DUF1311 domain-containing protein [Thetidibacter halocola]
MPAAAQDLVFSPQPTQACLASGQPFDQCIGLAADACTAANGYATVVQGGCLSREAEWWDGRLNAAYQRAMAGAKQSDSQSGQYAPSQAKALRAMQRAWIPFRDETCSFEASQWGGGTGAGPAFAACLMRLTAYQTHYLENIGLN